MINTGMIRKIDNLGRIVIPKEIRLSMNIKDDDDLQIAVENDQIILKKYSLLDGKIKESTILTKAFNELVDGNIVVSDREKVITPGPLYHKIIPLKISNLVASRESYISTEPEELAFEDIVLCSYFAVLPIIESSNVNGFVIFISANKTSLQDKKYIDVIKNIIENK